MPATNKKKTHTTISVYIETKLLKRIKETVRYQNELYKPESKISVSQFINGVLQDWFWKS